MPRGGARNRSGPKPDPNSARSDRRGLTLQALPADGYDGDAPAWPLDFQTNRESDLWSLLWGYPQAAAWAEEPHRWLTVANFVRLQVRLEDPTSPAGLYASWVRLADQLGLTPAGLVENGWSITAGREAEPEKAPKTPTTSSRARLSVVADAG